MNNGNDYYEGYAAALDELLEAAALDDPDPGSDHRQWLERLVADLRDDRIGGGGDDRITYA